MKSLFYLVSALLMVSGVKSQENHFGFTVGTTLSNYKVEVEDVSVASKTKMGLTLGLNSRFPIGKNLSFQPALNYVQKGGKIKEDGFKSTVTTNFLEIPLNLAIDLPSQTGKFFIGAGPSFSLGLWGKDKWELQGESGSDKIKFGKDKDFKSIEAGVNFIAGYASKSGVIITANYNTNISNPVESFMEFDEKFRNRYFGIRIGYLLF